EESSEDTIRSLKESEDQTTETLQAIRLKLAETEARVVSAEEEREAASKAPIEMESHSSAETEELQAQQSAAVAALEEKKRELASDVLTLKT
ncbi:hypothetical protein PF005_g16404, partial [Phytophthora fragariae]